MCVCVAVLERLEETDRREKKREREIEKRVWLV